MEETWRWFGPDDPISLAWIRQTGARGIVTALHHLPYGVVWSPEEIATRKALIEANPALGLRWSVVESLPVHEAVKIGEGDLEPYFQAYRQSLENLAAAGIRTVCYNFMPVLDWTRTDLAFPVAGGGTSLRFDAVKYAAFDVFMLARPGAEADHAPDLIARAQEWHRRSGENDRERLLATINAGLPGAYARYDIAGFREILSRYRDIGRDGLRENLARFLRAVVPTAEAAGVRLCIHPDDPPRPLFGLARIVSNGDDLEFIVNAAPSPANGVTFCTGSLGAGPANDVPALARRFARHIAFVHLRNVAKDADGSFVEAEHLGGDTDMVAVVDALLTEEARRRAAGEAGWPIPFRPDHGHELASDAGLETHPGYPYIGRLRGLAELRGVIRAVTALRA